MWGVRGVMGVGYEGVMGVGCEGSDECDVWMMMGECKWVETEWIWE